MKPAIQILNYNGMKWLPGLMESLSRVTCPEQIIYVVDNASTDDSLAWLQEHYPSVRIIRHDENLGYAEAYNRSIPVAFADGCDWVCLLNTDTLVSPDWLDALASAASDPGIGIMGPVFTKWEGSEPNYYMDGRCADVIPFMFDATRSPVDRDWVEGSALFIRRECYQQVGGMNPLYFMYWEEADLCRRARHLGWRVTVVPGSVCRHFAGGSGAGNGPGFLQLRNHFIYRLTDPFQSFLRNVISALRLSLTYAKQTVWDQPSFSRMRLLTRALWSAATHLGDCYGAWRQTRLAR
ncbi:MAG: glycosyltransferase family 2 protein [Planctomycetaceae bacterium]|nr:glycosyltransferase family 2 protein [Planctomycetaceae bacterium]